MQHALSAVLPCSRRNVFSCLVATALLANGAALAEASQEDDSSQALAEETVTVVATRTERRLGEVAATVSVKTAEQIEEEVARDIADLVRFEPGVSVAGTGSRFGLAGFRIRGIGGNRVLTLIDGVRLPDEFTFGPFLSARRDYVDIDSLRRADIARGPVSALWGSDALGGVVALTTKDPHHRLDADEAFSAAFKVGYSSADASTVGTVDLAGRHGALSGMLLYTRRAGQETDNSGSVGGTGPTRERPDPQDVTVDNVTAKIAYSPSERHRLTLGIDQYASDVDTKILSDYGQVVFGTTITRRDANDTRERERFSLNYRYRADPRGASDFAFADTIDATLYRQQGITRQHTNEDRVTRTRAMQTRRRDSRYEQRIKGVALQMSKGFTTGDIRHALTWGADHFTTHNVGLRDGGSFAANGAPVREFQPFPTRGFPITDVTQTALFAQNEMTLFNGALLLSPGLRFDRFDAKAKADAIYQTSNPKSPPPEDYNDSEVTAKLGAVYRVTETLSAYVGYSEGFRAPPYDDVNVGFENLLAGYKTISNSALQSERSRGVELGARFANSWSELSWTLFRNDYKNFIESLALAPQFLATRGIDPADGFLTFQSINRAKARIQGSEASASVAFRSGFSGRLAIAYADGEDLTADAPLASIEPLTAVLGLGYDAGDGRWGGKVIWTLARGKDAADVPANDPRPLTAGYGIVDLLAHCDIGSHTRVNVGLFNLTDKNYMRWADSAGVGNDALARFTQPGFNGGVTVRVEF